MDRDIATNKAEGASRDGTELFLDGVFLAHAHEGRAEVQRRHRVEVLVASREAAHHAELRVEKVFSVATVGHAIVDDRLQDDFHCCLSVE